jgi:hypothetical protein
MENIEAFVRQVMGTCDRRKPLLIHFDDYVGIDDQTTLETLALSTRDVSTLANYYGFATTSYANVIRDLVYGNPQEYWFSPAGFCNRNRKCRENHPRLMGMHVVSSWVMAYSLLNLATTDCTLEPFLSASFYKSIDDNNKTQSSTNKIGTLLGDGFTFQGKPLATPSGIPPPITLGMSLVEVATEWRRTKEDSNQPNSTNCKMSHICSFAWFANMWDRMNETVLSKHEVEKVGWEFVRDHNKLGFAPVGGLYSKVAWVFDEIVSSGAKTVIVVAMKSYGEKWANSTTGLRAFKVKDGQGNMELIASSEILGYHASSTSINSTHFLSLNDTLAAGEDLRLELMLTAGSKAKIMGLVICD